jgi:hypothetical protein
VLVCREMEEEIMVLAIEILDGLLTLLAVMIVGRTFRNAEKMAGDEERIRTECERGLTQIETYLTRHHHHRTR